MDRQYIEEHQVIERYLQGRLTPDEQQAFEETYLGEPAIIEQLELAERLQQGLGDLEKAGDVRRSTPPRWISLLSSPQYAAAASVLLLVSLVFSAALYRENLSLQGAQGLTAGAPTRLVPLISVRGSNINVIMPPSEEEWVVLMVDPGFLDYQTFRATVTRRGQAGVEPVWQVEGIEPGYEDLLAVGMPGNVLAPGDYEVLVEGRLADWPADRGFDQVVRLPLRVEPGP